VIFFSIVPRAPIAPGSRPPWPGEATQTDIGFTGGGSGAGVGMVYVGGVADHKIENNKMIDHIVELVEAKASEMEAAKAAAEAEASQAAE
jgi:(E)-4-hydroxy-3-methylbut-2-enyl-diphosphate synthase